MKEHIRQASMDVKKQVKIAINGAESRLKTYFSPKGADVYTRFVRRMFFFLILAGIAAAIIIMITIFFSRIGAPLTKVPDVIGMDVVNASMYLQDKNLVVQMDSKFDEKTEKFTVIDQYPKKGLTVRQGRMVKLIISMGKDVYEVPDLLGMDRGVAEELLRGKGIPYVITVIQTEDAATNAIIHQDLNPGKMVPRSVKLNLTANSDVGRNDYRVVEFVGQNLEYAVTSLYQNGMTPRLVKEIVNTPDLDGMITKQEYQPGAVIPKNSTVQITVGVYGEDDYEKAKYDYHIYQAFITKKADEGNGEGLASVTIKDELGEERDIFSDKDQYGKTILVTFKSFGTTKLTLVVDNFLREEKTYD